MKKIPIGITNFEEIIEKNFYYVDKSLLINSIIQEDKKVTLIPRPRRFGKTLNLSMLHYFFEKRSSSKAYLFNNLAISSLPECMKFQGQYPVIYLTFKDVKTRNWQECKNHLYGLIVDEFRRHRYLLESNALDDSEKNEYRAVINRTGTSDLFQNALKHLAAYLCRHHNKKAIILIDEYDTPIHAGFLNNYYADALDFIRALLSSGLKDNDNLEWAVVTGILRVAKESIFSGLNNLHICSLIDECNADMFGFTEPEVSSMLVAANLSSTIDSVAHWYDGYQIGSVKIYNPWSINNYVNNNGRFDSYWINTSSNDIIKDLLLKSDSSAKEDLEQLISGKSIRKKIDLNIVFLELEEHAGAVWSFLLFSGYLTFKNLTFTEQEPCVADLLIPNAEVHLLYKEVIEKWFLRGSLKKSYSHLLTSLIAGNIEEFTVRFYDFVADSFSLFDVTQKDPERFYHAFVLGMVASLQKEYEIKSNRESGFGRYDVMLIPHDKRQCGVIFEFKKVNARIGETLEQAADRAVQQIKDKQYANELQARGISKIIELGIAFEGKKALIKQG